MNRINEIDNTIEGKEIKTYDQDHPELVVLSGRLYGKVTYVEYFDAYYGLAFPFRILFKNFIIHSQSCAMI